MKPRWNQEETEILIRSYPQKSVPEIARLLNRSVISVIAKIYHLKLVPRGEPISWSRNEVKFLRENYSKISSQEVANQLGRTRNSVRQQAGKLGFSKPRTRIPFNKVLSFYESGSSTVEIGKKFKISGLAISKRLRRHGVRLRSRGEAIKLQYKKSGRRSAMFGKKGSQAGNWKGGKSIERGYVLIYNLNHPRSHRGRVREHIVVWEEHHGKRLPNSWVIHHLNGIRSDNRPENLIAMPDKKHDKLIPEMKARIKYLEDQNEKLSQKIKKLETDNF